MSESEEKSEIITDSEEIPKRINLTVSPRVADQMFVKYLIPYFKLFFTEKLASEVMETINNYAKMITATTQITKYSIYRERAAQSVLKERRVEGAKQVNTATHVQKSQEDTWEIASKGTEQ